MDEISCNKNCIANLNGKCCVEKCKGQLISVGLKNADKEQRSRFYEMASVMFEEDSVPSKTSVMRDKVNGKEIYCRVPIRRKRTPISQYDIEDFMVYQSKNNLTDEQMLEKAVDIADMGDTYWAGKIFSYVDMKNGQECAFIDFEEESKNASN